MASPIILRKMLIFTCNLAHIIFSVQEFQINRENLCDVINFADVSKKKLKHFPLKTRVFFEH